MTLHGSTGVDLIRQKVRTLLLGSLNVAEGAVHYKLRRDNLLHSHSGDLPIWEGAQVLGTAWSLQRAPALAFSARGRLQPLLGHSSPPVCCAAASVLWSAGRQSISACA